MNSILLQSFIAVMVVLGLVRIWTMYKVGTMVPAEQRQDVFGRIAADPKRTPESWETELGDGAAALIRTNRIVSRLGIVITIAFAAAFIVNSFMN